MDRSLIQRFQSKWEQYFPGSALPIAVIYTDEEPRAEPEAWDSTDRCMIGNLLRVLQGETFVYHRKTPGCPGGKRYSGYASKLRPDFTHFLSCGIPGKVEGERYKQSPELVARFMEHVPTWDAPGQYLVFKRWDRLEETDEPRIVLFVAEPDVLSGLFTLANFDQATRHGVIAPMGSGCASILEYPMLEAERDEPRCVLGMFDVSARPSFPPEALSFAIPYARFVELEGQMDDCFLITDSWKKVTSRWSSVV